jgi:hypothetical protein
MRTIVLAGLVCALAGSSAYAQGPSCKAQATEKKLAGAAKASFTKKCVTDAVGA